jgi:hypothetical protein
LWEEGQKYQNHNVKKHNVIVELPGSDFIVVACPQEMDNTSDGKDD